MIKSDDYQKVYDLLKTTGLDDQEIERIIFNLSVPSADDMKNSIERVLRQINS